MSIMDIVSDLKQRRPEAMLSLKWIAREYPERVSDLVQDDCFGLDYQSKLKYVAAIKANTKAFKSAVLSC